MIIMQKLWLIFLYGVEGLGDYGVLPNKGPIVRYSRVRKYRIGEVGVKDFRERIPYLTKLGSF